MKKLFRVMALVLMTALVTMMLAGCGEESTTKSSVVSGKTYVFSSYTVDGVDATEDIALMYDTWTLAFADDGTCTQTIVWAADLAAFLGSDPVETSGTYEESSSTLTVMLPSDEEDLVMTFEITSDTLSMEEDGYVTTFSLQG